MSLMFDLANEQDLSLTPGVDFSLTVTWQDGDGNNVDTTAYTVRMKVRRFFEPEAIVVNWEDYATEGAAGTVVITVPADQTARLGTGVYRYTITAEHNTTESVRSLETGKLYVRHPV